MAKTKGIKLIANNKKAFHDYFIEEKYEAGIELVGTEVKSVRQGHCSIKEAFIRNNAQSRGTFPPDIHTGHHPYPQGESFLPPCCQVLHKFPTT